MLGGFGAVIFAVGIGAWIYNQFAHRTNNPQTSLIAAVVVGIVAFIVFFTAFHSFLHSSG